VIFQVDFIDQGFFFRPAADLFPHHLDEGDPLVEAVEKKTPHHVHLGGMLRPGQFPAQGRQALFDLVPDLIGQPLPLLIAAIQAEGRRPCDQGQTDLFHQPDNKYRPRGSLVLIVMDDQAVSEGPEEDGQEGAGA